MKNKRILTILAIPMLFIAGCSPKKTAEVNVLATTDLHGSIPYEISSYVDKEREKDKNITVVDAGDFLDREGEASYEMEQYFKKKADNYRNNTNDYVELPIAKEMKEEIWYDTVTLGNHEFVCNDKKGLDELVSDFNKQGIDVLSANTYKKNGESYVKPYKMKNVETPESTVKLGILGLTIKEVDERYEPKADGTLEENKSRDLKDMDAYHGQLYMNDLVLDAQKWVKEMEKEKPDIIIAVAHTGEKPKKPKNPGNRIQDLAQKVDGIDAIVAGHTHTQIEQHDYKNKSGKDVIVTQPGKHGECISKINFKLEKDGENWKVTDKSSKLTSYPKKLDLEKGWELDSTIEFLEEKDKEVELSSLTKFEWDKAYVFGPNTSKEKLYKTVGQKWRKIGNDGREKYQQVVYMKENKVVCYVYSVPEWVTKPLVLDKSSYKDNVAIIKPKENDRFKVERDSENEVKDLVQQ